MLFVILFAGLYLLTISMMMMTKDILNFIMFRLIPFLTGLVLMFHACKNLGWFSFL